MTGLSNEGLATTGVDDAGGGLVGVGEGVGVGLGCGEGTPPVATRVRLPAASCS